MLTEVRQWLREEPRQAASLGVSALALLLSFVDVRVGWLDPAWLAVLLCGVPILCHPVDDSFSRSIICFNLQNKSFVILSVLTILRIARKRGTAFWYGRTLHRRPFHTAF